MFLLRWALLFFIVAVIAAIFGFGGVAVGAVDIAQTLFFIFIVIFAILLVAGLFVGRTIAGPPA
jgi:uncharacterized membrane protein YtjA (UPF0391 family)